MSQHKRYNLFALFATLIVSANFIEVEACTFKPDSSVQCETIDYQMCLSHLMYTNTSFPNVYNHQSLAQSRIFLDGSGFLMMDDLNCSQYSRLLICSAVYPLCQPGLFQRVDPCRELCNTVRDSCEMELLEKTGYLWPSALDCEQFPRYGTKLCIWNQNRTGCSRSIPTISTETSSTSSRRINSMSGIDPTALPSACLGHLSLINNTRANFGGIERCVEPCQGVYFEHHQNILLVVWTVSLSLLSMIISVLISVTYVVSYKTIPRLESPIYCIALCYAVLGLVNVISMAVGKDSIICDQSVHNSYNQTVLISNGLTSPACSILFSLTYYFTLCTWSWWVILTVQWSLSSISCSDIGNVWRVIMHFVAWGVPLPFLLTALVNDEFSGDPITQSCWVHKNNEISFLIAPLSASFLLCSFIIVVCFARVTNLQNKRIKNRDRREVEPGTIKPSLLFRTGTYVTFYLLPTGVLLCCYMYNYWFRKRWENAYLDCSTSSSLQVCKTVPNADKPLLPVYMTQITSSVFMGFVSIFWLLQHKSLLAWRNLCCLCCVWNMKQYRYTDKSSPLAQTRPTTATPTQLSRESQV